MKSTRPDAYRICAIIVTHFPDAGLPERVDSIARQVSAVLIIDNGSPGSSNITALRRLRSESPVEVVLNRDNLGVATALNQGLRWALDNRYHWALMLDQDTVIEGGIVAAFQAAYDQHPTRERIAVIGSNYWDPARQRELYRPTRCEVFVRRATVITSGSLLSMAAHETIGPFRDDFFIDHVDDEYCLRSRAKGFDVVLACPRVMVHVLGRSRARNLVLFKTWTSNHPASRWYYMTRNHVVLIREYFLKEPKWVIRTLAHKAARILLMVLFEEDRSAKCRLLVRGVLDGLKINVSRDG